VCANCLQVVPARVVQKDKLIYLQKRCPLHGQSLVLLHTDLNYYRRVVRSVTNMVPRDNPFNADCRVDCGICPDHAASISAVILELLDMCDMRCPTCVAGSSPTAGNIRSATSLASRLDEIRNLVPTPSLVMLSGGEPTIHPEFSKILNYADSKGFHHLMVITNGRLIAESKSFARSLSTIKNLEIYLQFDSLNDDALTDIRGSKLRNTRLRAIRNLQEAGIPATLVCVVKRGVNDQEMSSIVDFALTFNNIRGVTFQPLRFMGRTEGSSPDCHSITLSEVRTRILESSAHLRSLDFGPHPLSPETVCIGYLSRRLGVPVTSKVFHHLYSSSGQDVAPLTTPSLFAPPQFKAPGLNYSDLFRVSIVSYLDRYTFTEEAARLCSFAFKVDEGKYIPLDTYYLFYQLSETLLTSIV